MLVIWNCRVRPTRGVSRAGARGQGEGRRIIRHPDSDAMAGVVMVDAGMYQVNLSVSADRPFLYFVRDQPTGAILFMGRVLDSKT